MGISAPPAGSAPNGKPNAVPRSQGFQERRQSSRPIQGRPTGMTSAAVRRRWAATHSASPTAKMADRDHDDVDAVGQQGLAEGEPLLPGDRSMPTRPIASPRPSEAKPRSRDAPSTAVTARTRAA